MEMDQTQRQQFSSRKKRMGGGGGGGVGGQRRKRLDPALQGLMGEANLRYARGDRETAIRMCFEVIRQDPSVPEPFQTLSTIYEESGEQEKSLQLAILAAHLAPQDAEEWARLADMSIELEDPDLAISCYRKGLTWLHLLCRVRKRAQIKLLLLSRQPSTPTWRTCVTTWPDAPSLSGWGMRGRHSGDTGGSWEVPHLRTMY